MVNHIDIEERPTNAQLSHKNAFDTELIKFHYIKQKLHNKRKLIE